METAHGTHEEHAVMSDSTIVMALNAQLLRRVDLRPWELTR